MEFTAMLGSIGLCVGAIVAAAVIYFVVTAIKGKRAERKERETLKQHRDQQEGVRTESWTAGRSGLEVRMYSREKVE
uniref:hypothetical protein n=1 Tax=Collinsella aerofaciens TaxID=74426 RepID=UPI003D795A4D